MFAVYLGVVIATLVLNAAAGAADFLRARFVLANSTELGVSEGWLPLLGALKAAGAVGLLVGFLWVPVGFAAALGLTLFFIGAMAVHVRARVLYNLAFPGFYLALAIGSLVLIAAR